MKNKIKIFIIFAVFVSLIIGCNNIFTPDELDENGMGYFILRFTDEPEVRTIMPGFGNDVRDSIVGYTLKLTNVSNNAETYIYRTKVEFDAAEGMVRVNPGLYYLHVTAYSEYEDEDDNVPVAAGVYGSGGDLWSIMVPAAFTIPITLKPIKTDGEGTFSWDIGFNYSMLEASMEILPLTSGATVLGSPINLLGSTSPNTKKESLTLNAGQYRVIFTLVKDNNTKPVTWRETLHVYSGLNSEFSHNFSENLFLQKSYTVTFMSDDDTVYDVVSVLHGSQVVRPPNPSHEIWMFLDWYTDEDILWNFTTTITKDVVLYANWFKPDYVISGSEGIFTAKSTTFTSSPGSIQSAIDAIRGNAGGSAISIWFNGGVDQFNQVVTLDIETGSITFSGGWGKVTLIGNITSNNAAASTITVEGNVSIESQAVISNTASATAGATAITNSGSGTVTITGGTVRASGAGFSIDNTANGIIAVEGGTVMTQNNNGIAIINRAAGTVNVTGGTVSATTPGNSWPGDTSSTAIVNKAGGSINVSGGTVAATNIVGESPVPNGRRNDAISNESSGTITITGGTVSSIVSGIAISLQAGSTGAVNISGGAIRAAHGICIWNGGTGKITIMEGASIITSGSATTFSISNPTAVTEITGGSISNTQFSGGSAAIINYGIMTITNASIFSQLDNALSNFGTVTINDGAILSSGNSLTASRVAVSNTGTITMEGGEIRSNNGIVFENSMSGKLIMNGGLIYGGGRGVQTTGLAGEITVNAGEISSPEDAIRLESTGTVTINGGKLTTIYGFAINNLGQGNVVLNGTPEITGRIRTADGKLRTLPTFAPAANQYLLDFASYAASIIAVVDGTDFLSSFTLNDQDDWELVITDLNLVIRAK